MLPSPDFLSRLFISWARTRTRVGREFVKIVGKLSDNAEATMAQEATRGAESGVIARAGAQWSISGGKDECLYNAALLSAFLWAKSKSH
jgi:hypothetical protein